MLMNVAAKIKADKIKAVEAVEEMLIAEQERLAAIKYKLLRVVGSIMEGKMENLSLVSRDKVKLKISEDLAKSTSAYIESALNIGMTNGRNSEINLDADPKVLKTLGSFILLGPDHKELVDVQQMDTSTAFELMELSTQILIPWLCSHIAANIDISGFNAIMLKKADLQRETCFSEFCESWALVFTKGAQSIAQNIEAHSITPEGFV
jgi:hypothetical protein